MGEEEMVARAPYSQSYGYTPSTGNIKKGRCIPKVVILGKWTAMACDGLTLDSSWLNQIQQLKQALR